MKKIVILFLLMFVPIYSFATDEKPITDEIIGEYAKLYKLQFRANSAM